MNTTTPPSGWITSTPEQAIANIRYGQARCLPVDIPEGYQQKMRQFTFDWSHLKRVIADEAAHFAVRTSPTEIRVFTRHCTFGINLAVPYAQVSLDETIWMTELVSLHQAREEADKRLLEMLDELSRERNWRESAERKGAALEQALSEANRKARETTQALKAANRKAKDLMSRCMKLVRKFARRTKA